MGLGKGQGKLWVGVVRGAASGTIRGSQHLRYFLAQIQRFLQHRAQVSAPELCVHFLAQLQCKTKVQLKPPLVLLYLAAFQPGSGLRWEREHHPKLG